MLVEKKCNEFVEVLASKEPVPGGGGAASLVGSIGMALGNMVGNLTVGKKKYKEYETEINDIMKKALVLQNDLLGLVDSDANVFINVAAAYKMPKLTDVEIKMKNIALEKALKEACMVPVQIIEKCYDAIQLQRRLSEIGSIVAISDVGVGVLCLKAALISGKLNVIINLKGISDTDFVNKINNKINPLIENGVKLADETYQIVENRLLKK